MDVSTSLGNTIIDHLLRLQAFTLPGGLYLSAHTADPGLTGASEVGAAGSNGYNRVRLDTALTTAAASKAVATQAQLQITLPSTIANNTAIPWLGVWTAATGGAFWLRCPNVGTILEATITASTDTIDTGEVHGLSVGDGVTFSDISGTLPAGLTTNTGYFVKTVPTTRTLTISATSGGATLDLTADGGTLLRKINNQTFNPSNIVQIASGALTFTMATG